MNCSEFEKCLDLFIDGDLDEAQRLEFEAHAVACGECQERLKTAEQLREILSHMDDEISVPLPAQAAWRSAVRAEARRGRMRKIYRACGAIAAVCVLTLGVSAMLTNQSALRSNTAKVETDGVSEHAALQDEIAIRSVNAQTSDTYVEHRIAVEDLEHARAYLDDVVAEYGGTVEREDADGADVRVYVQIPGENAEDFISAADGIGEAPEGQMPEVDAAAEFVGVCVMMAAE